MADPKEPTRAELAEALLRSNAMMAEMAETIQTLRDEKAKPQVSTSDQVQLEILQLLKELRGSKPQSQHYFGPEIQKTAYDGFVQATESCVINMAMMNEKGQVDIHPIRYEEGNVFQVDVDQLWTDDPYVPVLMKGTDKSGVPLTEPHPNAKELRANFRFRQHAKQVEEPALKRASQY